MGVIFGFCISDCSGTGSNANAVQAAKVMSSLREYYPCNGGAFFWVAAHDTGGSWSKIVGAEILPYSGCSVKGPTISPRPTNAPISPPPSIPPTKTPTLAPVQNPSATPTTKPTACVESPGNKFFLKMKGKNKKNTGSHNGIGPAKDICKVSCGTCPKASPTKTPAQPTAVPTASPVQPGTCPSGFSGLIATIDCKGYFHCLEGSLITKYPIYCQSDLLFNNDEQYCDWPNNVKCASNPTPTPVPTLAPPTDARTRNPQPGSPTKTPAQPTAVPTASPVQPGTCPSGYSGLIATSDCKGFYHCWNGSLINGNPTPCPSR